MEETLQPAAMSLSDATRDTLAGAVSGISGVIAGQPLDVIRVRQQQQGGASLSGVGPWASLRSLLAREGSTALFRGMAYPVATSAFQNALVFQTYGRVCRLLVGEGEGQDGGETPAEPLPLADVAIAGGVAGLVQTSVCTPVELLKIRLQLQTATRGSPSYVGSLAMLSQVVKSQGIPGLYRGAVVTAARDVPSFAAYFWTFEVVREALDPGSRAANTSIDTCPWAVLAAGGAAGLAAWLTVYPLDLVKARLQARTGPGGPGAWHIAVRMAAEEGPRSFFHGLTATVGRALLVNGAIFSVYEACHARLRLLG